MENKLLQNLHTHTIYCDGENTVEEIITQAIRLGFKSIGFSGHGYTPHTLAYCMTEENTRKYIEEVKKQREKYKGIIEVFLGTEFDLFSCGSLSEYDYVIGSVHYYKAMDGENYAFDIKSPEELQSRINDWFDGDAIRFAKAYYDNVARLPDKLEKMHIVGHFDLLLESNDRFNPIDTSSKKYRLIVTDCAKYLIEKGLVFEINSGAVSKGIKKIPYPESWVLKMINDLGGKITISSDCHLVKNLNFYFEESISLARQCGFKEIQYFNGKEFEPIKICD